MPKHLTATANAESRKCPLTGTLGPIDVIEVQGWDPKEKFVVARICAEFLGIAPGILHHGVRLGPEESTAVRKHKHTLTKTEIM